MWRRQVYSQHGVYTLHRLHSGQVLGQHGVYTLHRLHSGQVLGQHGVYELHRLHSGQVLGDDWRFNMLWGMQRRHLLHHPWRQLICCVLGLHRRQVCSQHGVERVFRLRRRQILCGCWRQQLLRGVQCRHLLRHLRRLPLGLLSVRSWHVCGRNGGLSLLKLPPWHVSGRTMGVVGRLLHSVRTRQVLSTLGRDI